MYNRNFLFAWGAAAFSLCMYFTYENWIFHKISIPTDAIILSNTTEINDEDNSRSNRPEVGFITTQGEAIKFEVSTVFQFKGYDVGEEVFVRYNVTNPFDVKLDTIFSIWWKCIAAFIFSVIAVFFAFKNPSSSEFKQTELAAIDLFIRQSNSQKSYLKQSRREL